MNTLIRSCAILVMTLFVASCGGGGGGSDTQRQQNSTPLTKKNVQVSWNANPETAVNQSGGGYNVYYSSTSGFSPGDPGVTAINVPYVSGATAPVTAQISVIPGTYYIRVAAYSALNAPGTVSGSTSPASTQITLIVP